MSVYRERRISSVDYDFPISRDALCSEIGRLLAPFHPQDLGVDDVLEALATIELDIGYPVATHRKTYARLAIALGFAGEELPSWHPQQSMWLVGRDAWRMYLIWREDIEAALESVGMPLNTVTR